MNFDVAKDLDSVYKRMLWAVEEYLIEELTFDNNAKIPCNGMVISSEVMYWMGYIYRYWHFYKDESSSKIYRQASFKTMKRNYMMFHTMDLELAIDDLIEIKRQR